MKRQHWMPLAALLCSVSMVCAAAEPPARPAGVTAENWIAVSDRLGIVLVAAEANVPVVPRDSRTGAQSVGPLLLKPPVGGYFMVKGADGWKRLVVVDPIKGPADAG